MKRFVLAAAASLFVIVSACGGNGAAGPNAPHQARCLVEFDCMGGYECQKVKDEFFGECVPKGTAVTAAPSKSAPAKSNGDDTASKTPPPKSTAAPKSTTPEPLPPPKPPKADAKPAPPASDFTP